MVKFLLLSGRGSRTIQGIASIALPFLVLSLLSIFPGSRIAEARVSSETLHQKPTLQSIQLDPGKEQEERPFPSVIVNNKKAKAKKFVPVRKKFKKTSFSFLVCKDDFTYEKPWLEFNTQTGGSCQITYLGSGFQSRAPPHIL